MSKRIEAVVSRKDDVTVVVLLNFRSIFSYRQYLTF